MCVGGLSRCREWYLSEAKGCLVTGKEFFEEDFPETKEEEMPWVIRHATVLARLLRQMPRLQVIEIQSSQLGVDLVIGQALLLLPGPHDSLSFDMI